MHEIDECRFDIGVSDCVWYLRAPSVEECRRWVNAIQEHKGYYQSLDNNNIGPSSLINGATLVSASGSLQPPPPLSSSSSSPSAQPLPPPPTPSQSSQPPSTTSSVVGYPINASDIVGLRRHESALSLSSITSCRSYKEQLSEMETFRTILYQQIKTLQHYFDSSLQSTNIVNEHLKRHRRHQSMNGMCVFIADGKKMWQTIFFCRFSSYIDRIYSHQIRFIIISVTGDNYYIYV